MLGAVTLLSSLCGAYAFSIPTVALNNGVQFPLVSLGTGGYNNSVARDAFSIAVGLNWTSVDTALDYGNQKGLAEVIAGVAREDLFVLSKVPGCGAPPILPQTEEGCYLTTKAALRTDLLELKIDRVDVMLLHFPPMGNVSGCSTPQACRLIQAQWRAMEEFYAQGGARAIGVSNYCESCFECLNETATVVPALNQVQYHAGMGPGPTKSLLEYCARRGIVVQAYAPLGGSSSVHPDDPYPLIHNQNLTAIGQRFNKSAVQVALRWVIQQGLPLATKSDRKDYMVEDTNIFDFELSDADMQFLADTPIDPDDPTRHACV
eukprot:Hpha_TRINITY_DN15912_c0_g1::TRINITY_DN15912_c0_g1_i1::g.70852::m.70852